MPLVAIGFTIVCAVCIFAAPTKLNYNGVNVPSELTRTAFESWAANHADEVICNFNIRITVKNRWRERAPRCAEQRSLRRQPGAGPNTGATPTRAQLRAAAALIARQNYSGYESDFLYPSDSLMIKSGLWLELEAVIGLIVGIGLASLLGQRTVSVILMIVLEIILTPIFSGRVSLTC